MCPKKELLSEHRIIPGFTTRDDVSETQQSFLRLGFTRFDAFEYVTESPKSYSVDGKAACERLKSIRKVIADANGIALTSSECHHKGNCYGTCPLCEAELAQLSDKLTRFGDSRVDSSSETLNAIKMKGNHTLDEDIKGGNKGGNQLQGDSMIVPNMNTHWAV